MTELVLQYAVGSEAQDPGVAVAVRHEEIAGGGDGDAGGLAEVGVVAAGNACLAQGQLRLLAAWREL